MNVLLVYPQYPTTFWSFKHALKFVRKKAAFPPLGLMTISSMLPGDWNKKLVDLNVRKLEDVDILWADMVFVSAMIVQKENAQEVINRCKSFGKTIVAGGPVFSSQPEIFSNVDHFVLNEAETTLPLFLEDLKNNTLKHTYSSEIRPDITKTALPDWSLINFKHYLIMPVQYSRGCPFDCEFCDIVIMNGKIPRTKTPGQMIAEFQLLYDSGWRGSVFIVDDNFIGNKKNVKELLPLLGKWQKENHYPFKFTTEASINLADDCELMDLMTAANFGTVFVGIETPNTGSLKECGKMQNAGRNLADSVKIIQQNGMQVMGGFIVGFDNDNENIFETQIKFIQSIGVVTAMVGVLTALPGTRLHKRLNAEGRLLHDSTGGNTDGNLNFEPKLGKEKLIDGYKKILSTIYSRKQYYKRINTFIKSYKPKTRGRMSMSKFRAFIRSLWRIGIVSRSRFQFWKLILKTSFTKPRALPESIELAILGVHFEKITQRVMKV